MRLSDAFRRRMFEALYSDAGELPVPAGFKIEVDSQQNDGTLLRGIIVDGSGVELAEVLNVRLPHPGGTVTLFDIHRAFEIKVE